MAKGSPLMGTQRGRLGEAVLYRKQGEQMSRAYIAHPSNPKSERQQVQRMVVATANAAYATMKDICNHSFERVTPGLGSMARFLSLNINLLRRSINADKEGNIESASAMFNYKGNPMIVPNEYIISRGTLPEIAIEDFPDDEAVGQFASYNFLPILYQDQHIYLYNEIPYWCADNHIEDDSYVTFVFLTRLDGDIIDGQQSYRFDWIRFYAYDTEGDLGHANNLKYSASSFAPLKGGGDMKFQWVGDQGAHQNNYGLDLTNYLGYDKVNIVGYTIIQSKWKDGKPWLRSNARMHLRTQLAGLELEFPGDISNPLESYFGNTSPVGSAAYVLNGAV